MYEDLFYKRLIEQRQKKGISARDMSLSIGQYSGYINYLENRRGYPSMQVFFYICEYLGVTPAEFFGGYEVEATDEKEILEVFRGLDSESKKAVMELMKRIK